jgi:hypothetical protein
MAAQGWGVLELVVGVRVAPTFLSAGTGNFPVASSLAPGNNAWMTDQRGFSFIVSLGTAGGTGTRNWKVP